jgi:transcriptional regulator with XRE-family HTH domain
MDQVVNAAMQPHESFGALLRAARQQACLSQQRLAAQAEVSERTVRNLEADRVRSPRADTVQLLADALTLSEPERETWLEVARGMPHRRAEPAAPDAGVPMRLPGDVRTPDDDRPTEVDRRELAELRRENCRLRDDVEILKRAAAFFAAATR